MSKILFYAFSKTYFLLTNFKKDLVKKKFNQYFIRYRAFTAYYETIRKKILLNLNIKRLYISNKKFDQQWQKTEIVCNVISFMNQNSGAFFFIQYFELHKTDFFS